MNLTERATLQNKQKESDYRNLKKLEEENQILKSQITALKEVLTQEESEKIDMFNQLSDYRKKLMSTQLSILKCKKVIIVLAILLFVLIIYIIQQSEIVWLLDLY